MGSDTNRIAAVSIIIEDLDSAGTVNEILHQNAPYIIGRMGIPYRDRGISVISIIMDAPNDAVSAMSGKLGRLPGVSAKALFSKKP